MSDESVTELEQPATDGPNHHHYRTFKRGTTFVQSTVVYHDGETHTFHVPLEAYGPQKPIEIEAAEHIESLQAELYAQQEAVQALVGALEFIDSNFDRVGPVYSEAVSWLQIRTVLDEALSKHKQLNQGE